MKPSEPRPSPEIAARAVITPSDLACVTGILLLGLFLRVIYLAGWALSPYFDCPLLDEQYHHEWALDIAHGRPVESKAYFRAPFYIYFLATIYRVFGDGPIAPRVAQALIGSLSAVLTYFLGRALFGRRIGAVAGALTAAYPTLIFFDGELLLPVLLVFFDVAFALALLRAWPSPRPLPWATAGLLGGLSAITRPNILLPMLCFGLWKAWRWQAWNPRGAGAGAMAAFALGAALAIAPVTIRNRVVAGDWTLIASQGGIVLYAGNGPEADGFVPRTPVVYSRFGRYEDTFELYAQREAESALGRPLQPSEVSRYWTRRTARHIASDPVGWMRLMGRKAAGFWTRVEVRNNKNLDFALQYAPPIAALRGVLHFAWIGTLALVGLVWVFRVAPQARPISALVLLYAASFLPFFNCDRYRAPMLPFLILLAVWTLHRLGALAWGRRWRALCAPLTGLAAAALLVNVDWFGLDPQPTAEDEWMVAVCYEEKGDIESARLALERAVAEDPRHAGALHNLGNFALRRGDRGEAGRWYRQALEADPRFATAHNSEGVLLAMEGRAEEARASFERCLALDPFHALAWMNLADLSARAGDVSQAEANYRRAGDAQPHLAAPWLALARLALRRGDEEEARGMVARALASGEPSVEATLESDPSLAGLRP